MHTIMLCSCGVFSTAMRWSPTRFMRPSAGHRFGGVLEQRLLEGRIAPGPGDDARADMRADLGLVGLDDAVERGRVDIAFLGQHGFERADARLHLGQFGAVVVMMVIVGMVVVIAMAASRMPRRPARRVAARTIVCDCSHETPIAAIRPKHRRRHRPPEHGGRPRRDLGQPVHRAGGIRGGGAALRVRHRLDRVPESVIYAHAALFMLAAAWTLRTGGHVRVDVFYAEASPDTGAVDRSPRRALFSCAVRRGARRVLGALRRALLGDHGALARNERPAVGLSAQDAHSAVCRAASACKASRRRSAPR